MKRYGITGGIGSGKSTVCRLFALLGVPVFDSDAVAKSLYSDDRTVYDETLALFGDAILDSRGAIDRKKLGAVLFGNKMMVEKLNAIVHPAVGRRFESWCAQHSNAPYVLKEAAILFESGAFRQVEQVILVTCPSDMRIQRVMQREGISREEVQRRIDLQWTDEEKMKHTSLVIRNNEQELLIPQVLAMHTLLLGQK